MLVGRHVQRSSGDSRHEDHVTDNTAGNDEHFGPSAQGRPSGRLLDLVEGLELGMALKTAEGPQVSVECLFVARKEVKAASNLRSDRDVGHGVATAGEGRVGRHAVGLACQVVGVDAQRWRYACLLLDVAECFRKDALTRRAPAGHLWGWVVVRCSKKWWERGRRSVLA